ncbi:MAG TPA: DinB family protein [Ktedonobacterales bacterium]
MLDFDGVRQGDQTLADLARNLSHADLHTLTDEMIDTVLAIIEEATAADVVFVPEDPDANDAFGASAEVNLPWTLGHVIVHATASSEEAAALGSALARGIEIEGRSRYETDWRTIRSVAQVRQRLEESRHMRHAFLDSWPYQPHLEVMYTGFASLGPMNATGRFLLGLMHEDSHLAQLREIMRQAHEGYSRVPSKERATSRLSGLLPFLRK